jgi:tRNA nucleotidyltransferase (CCA-adding enzyme)
VTFLADVDEDLARRDFTVNALAWDPLAGELRDPFGGQADLAARLLRAVGDPAARFGEDGLRPLRAVRFVAQLGFALDRPTRDAIAPSLPVTAKVAVERITAELSKLLVAPHARAALDLLAETGLLGLTLPAVADLLPELRRHAFEATAQSPPELPVRLAALLHPLAASGTGDSAAEAVRAFLVGLRLPGHVVAFASELVARHGCLLAPGRPAAPEAPAEVRRWLAAAGPGRADALLALWRADARSLCSICPPGRAEAELSSLERFEARLAEVERERPPLSVAELALDGRAVMGLLGLTPGAEVGEALRHLLERVLDEPSLNTREALASELERWWRGRGVR